MLVTIPPTTIVRRSAHENIPSFFSDVESFVQRGSDSFVIKAAEHGIFGVFGEFNPSQPRFKDSTKANQNLRERLERFFRHYNPTNRRSLKEVVRDLNMEVADELQGEAERVEANPQFGLSGAVLRLDPGFWNIDPRCSHVELMTWGEAFGVWQYVDGTVSSSEIQGRDFRAQAEVVRSELIDSQSIGAINSTRCSLGPTAFHQYRNECIEIAERYVNADSTSRIAVMNGSSSFLEGAQSYLLNLSALRGLVMCSSPSIARNVRFDRSLVNSLFSPLFDGAMIFEVLASVLICKDGNSDSASAVKIDF